MKRKPKAKSEICRHYRGTVNKFCEAGINIRQHVGGDDLGWATRLPCIKCGFEANGPIVPCDKYSPFTPEEIAEQDAYLEKKMDEMMLAMPVIAGMKKRHRNESAKEVVECPVCKGKLHLTISSCNGHVWGKCETKNCLAWME